MRIAVTVAAYLVSLAVTAICSLFAVLLLAGPHAGHLPQWLEPVVLGLGWLAVIGVPLLLARAVWRRWGRREQATHSPGRQQP